MFTITFCSREQSNNSRVLDPNSPSSLSIQGRLCIVAITGHEFIAPYMNPVIDWLIDWGKHRHGSLYWQVSNLKDGGKENILLITENWLVKVTPWFCVTTVPFLDRTTQCTSLCTHHSVHIALYNSAKNSRSVSRSSRHWCSHVWVTTLACLLDRLLERLQPVLNRYSGLWVTQIWPLDLTSTWLALYACSKTYHVLASDACAPWTRATVPCQWRVVDIESRQRLRSASTTTPVVPSSIHSTIGGPRLSCCRCISLKQPTIAGDVIAVTNNLSAAFKKWIVYLTYFAIYFFLLLFVLCSNATVYCTLYMPSRYL